MLLLTSQLGNNNSAFESLVPLFLRVLTLDPSSGSSEKMTPKAIPQLCLPVPQHNRVQLSAGTTFPIAGLLGSIGKNTRPVHRVACGWAACPGTF